MLQSSNLQFKQLMLEKLTRLSQLPQNKQNANHDNHSTQKATKPPVPPTNSETSSIISVETTLRKMAIPSKKTNQEMKVAFHKPKAQLSKTTTAITKT